MAHSLQEGEAKAVFDFDPAVCPHHRWVEQFADARAHCPVFWSPAHGGYWVTSRYADATRVARD